MGNWLKICASVMLCMVLCLTGCFAENVEMPDITVEKGETEVKITFSPEILGMAAEEEALQELLNEDGTMTLALSWAAYEEMLANYSNMISAHAQSLVTGETAVPSFEHIEFNDDFSQVIVFVYGELYTGAETVYVTFFHSMGVVYQLLAGVAEEDAEVAVQFADTQTQEVYDTVTFQEFMEWLEMQQTQIEE